MCFVGCGGWVRWVVYATVTDCPTHSPPHPTQPDDHREEEAFEAEAAAMQAAVRGSSSSSSNATSATSNTSSSSNRRQRGGREVIDPSLLWFIHGRAYDLRPFLRVHPGGAEALLQGRGQDCTVRFVCFFFVGGVLKGGEGTNIWDSWVPNMTPHTLYHKNKRTYRRASRRTTLFPTSRASCSRSSRRSVLGYFA